VIAAQPVDTVIGAPAALLGYRGRFDVVVGALAMVQLGTMLIWLLAAYLAGGQRRRSHLRTVAALPVYWLAHWARLGERSTS